jgi:nitroimidazol reductase NimA-like FMN-containing flavoprotein (pyridoxamine 5'-phosphate oxidase superfamily)
MKQGDVALLNDPVAREMLNSAIPARLAYVWRDGTPRIIPIWFHWTGREVVLCSPPNAPKVKALGLESKVAITIDTESWPAKVLSIRGTARSKMIDGEMAEYPALTMKYLGDGAEAWRKQYAALFPRVLRISVVPEWVAILDVGDNRLPSAIEAAASAAT